MFGYSTISSDNDAIHINAQLLKDHTGKWVYSDPAITVYQVGDDGYRKETSKILVIWDYEPFLQSDLYKDVSNFCEAFEEDEGGYSMDLEVEVTLQAAKVDPFEFREMLDQAIDLGMIKGTSRNPFQEINRFLSR